MRSDNLKRHMLRHHRQTESESAVPILNSVINHLNDQPAAMKVIPSMNSSKSDDTVETPAKRMKIGTPMAPRKEYDEDDDDDDEMEKLLNQLVVLSELIVSGYKGCSAAIIDTVNTLRDLDGITDEQYQSLSNVIHRYL